MKLTKTKLKQIVKEEIEKVLSEDPRGSDMVDTRGAGAWGSPSRRPPLKATFKSDKPVEDWLAALPPATRDSIEEKAGRLNYGINRPRPRFKDEQELRQLVGKAKEGDEFAGHVVRRYEEISGKDVFVSPGQEVEKSLGTKVPGIEENRKK